MKSSLDAVLAQYEKNKSESTQSDSKPRLTQEERLKKYFSPNLDKNESEGEKNIRILPNPEGGSPFTEVWFHEIQVGGKWVKLYDPAKNEDGARSPLAEVEAALKADGTEKSKDLAKSYRSKKFYIVKIIDRSNEADGPKFWRFKHNWKGQGPFDKIIAIYRKKGDISDPITGRDITLTLQKTTTNKITYYTEVSNVLPEDVAPLHEDAAVAKAWLEDPMTWKDAYSKKPIEYLEGVAKGYVPEWNSNLKRYTYADSEIGGAELGGDSDASQFMSAATSQDDIDDDLPF